MRSSSGPDVFARSRSGSSRRTVGPSPGRGTASPPTRPPRPTLRPRALLLPPRVGIRHVDARAGPAGRGPSNSDAREGHGVEDDVLVRRGAGAQRLCRRDAEEAASTISVGRSSAARLPRRSTAPKRPPRSYPIPTVESSNVGAVVRIRGMDRMARLRAFVARRGALRLPCA